MTAFKAAYTNELIKMRRKSKLVTGAVLSLAAALLWQLALSLVGSGIGVKLGDATGFALSVLGFYTTTLLPLFAVFVVIDSFNGEYAANTMKQTLTRPLARLGIFSSKVCAIATYVLASLALMMLVTTCIGFVGSPQTFSLLNLWRILVAYAVTWLPVMVFMLLVVLLAQLSPNGILTFFLAVFTFIGLHAMRLFFPQLSNMLIVPLFDWYVGWIASSSNIAALLRQTVLLISSGLIFFGLGCRMFERKEL